MKTAKLKFTKKSQLVGHWLRIHWLDAPDELGLCLDVDPGPFRKYSGMTMYFPERQMANRVDNFPTVDQVVADLGEVQQPVTTTRDGKWVKW